MPSDDPLITGVPSSSPRRAFNVVWKSEMTSARDGLLPSFPPPPPQVANSNEAVIRSMTLVNVVCICLFMAHLRIAISDYLRSRAFFMPVFHGAVPFSLTWTRLACYRPRRQGAEQQDETSINRRYSRY